MWRGLFKQGGTKEQKCDTLFSNQTLIDNCLNLNVIITDKEDTNDNVLHTSGWLSI